MTTTRDLERRLAEHFHGEAPSRAPDWILSSALMTIDTTRQRRGLTALRRTYDMPTYAKLAAAAVVVIAVGAYALWRIAPSGPGGPGPSPTPTAPPTSAPRPAPSSTLIPYVPPALTGSFTSNLHGLSLSYPEGWTEQAATVPWTDANLPPFGDPAGDFIYDPARDDHLFLALASQPLGSTSFDDWLTDFLVAEGCARTDRLAIDGADRAFGTDCGFALFSSNGRGYIIALHVSVDDADLRSFDSAAWLEDILATVQLHPEDAVDEAPTASP